MTHFEIYQDGTLLYPQYRWRLKAGNNKIIATSGEGYWNEKDCEDAIGLVKASWSAPVRRAAA